MLVAQEGKNSVLTVTERGFGKRTPLDEYPRYSRGTKGVIAIQCSERNGPLVGAVLVDDSDEIMLITNTGVLVRTRVEEIRAMGRATQGVTLINVDEGGRLSGVYRVLEQDVDDMDDESEDDSADDSVDADTPTESSSPDEAPSQDDDSDE